MPRENTTPEAILEAIRKIDILSELLEDKQKNNLKMIAEGKEAGGKQIGPYARLLTYAPGEPSCAKATGAETLFTSRSMLSWTCSRAMMQAPKEKLVPSRRERASARCRSSPACLATRRSSVRI